MSGPVRQSPLIKANLPDQTSTTTERNLHATSTQDLTAIKDVLSVHQVRSEPNPGTHLRTTQLSSVKFSFQPMPDWMKCHSMHQRCRVPRRVAAGGGLSLSSFSSDKKNGRKRSRVLFTCLLLTNVVQNTLDKLYVHR
ncbi:hypothetical protein RUM44_012689 [Polyplax serrata]|uniref:Uncharacterized protein n=1 Tax=Polyplax serrata TaxID=468196 RepID=A0ABR1BE27_POLSC